MRWCRKYIALGARYGPKCEVTVRVQDRNKGGGRERWRELERRTEREEEAERDGECWSRGQKERRRQREMESAGEEGEWVESQQLSIRSQKRRA